MEGGGRCYYVVPLWVASGKSHYVFVAAGSLSSFRAWCCSAQGAGVKESCWAVIGGSVTKDLGDDRAELQDYAAISPHSCIILPHHLFFLKYMGPNALYFLDVLLALYPKNVVKWSLQSEVEGGRHCRFVVSLWYGIG